MPAGFALARVRHPLWGMGFLIRIEGTDWIVQLESDGQKMRVPTEKRREFEVLPASAASPALAAGDGEPASQPVSAPDEKPGNRLNSQGVNSLLQTIAKRTVPQAAGARSPAIQVRGTTDPPVSPPSEPAVVHPSAPTWNAFPTWHKKRAIESLANGLPPSIAIGRQLAVDFDATTRMIERFLGDVSEDGGCALLVKGGYGQGKTFALRCLEEIAVEAGFLVARTEIDATENRLNKPHHIYRDLLRHLRVPGHAKQGAIALAEAANAGITKQINAHATNAQYRFDWLNRNLECPPLAWLFADPQIDTKRELLGLLACDPSVPTAHARLVHAIEAEPRRWPAFTAGTQGDFGSFLLSGIGRLARLIGFKGLILIMDEMEKWQDLNWNQQSQAGNLLGGLIWGATARTDRNRRPTYQTRRGAGTVFQYPGGLTHSIRCGGFPFSTEAPCHVGLAIAMTPRSEEESPERTWAQYGPLLDVDLPRLNVTNLQQYCRRVGPLFADAYETRHPTGQEVKQIIDEAVLLWRTHGEMTNRAAVQSAVAAFHSWRDRAVFHDPA